MRNLFIHPTRRGWVAQLIMLWIAALAAIVWGGPARSDTPAESQPVELRVSSAIDHLIGRVASPVRSGSARHRFVASVARASSEHAVPPLLMVAIAYREGSFRNDVEGTLGERSTYQMHGRAARGCDLTTYAGASDCAARWLRVCYDRCDSWDGAVSLYASGRVCHPDRPRLTRVVRDRVSLWQRLEAL